MQGINEVDRSKILDVANINSAIFTEYEVQRLHEIALELDKLRQIAIGRIH